MKYCSSKDINLLVRQLIQEGWQYQKGKKHGKLYSSLTSRILIVPSSPSDTRAFMNFRQDVLKIKKAALF